MADKRVPTEGQEVVYRNRKGKAIGAKVLKVLPEGDSKATLLLEINNEGKKSQVEAPYGPSQTGGWEWPDVEEVQVEAAPKDKK
jgi:hypothetical protein